MSGDMLIGVRAVATSIFFSLMAAAALAESGEHSLVLEFGPAAEWPLHGERPNYGGTIAVEKEVIENWLELELGITANCLVAIVGDVFGPAVAAVTLGLYAREQLARRFGWNSAFDHTGNVAIASWRLQSAMPSRNELSSCSGRSSPCLPASPCFPFLPRRLISTGRETWTAGRTIPR